MRYRGGWEITHRFSPSPSFYRPGKKRFRSLIRLDSKEEVSRVKETRWILIERYRKKSFVYDIRGNFADPYILYILASKRNARYLVSRYTFISFAGMK